MRQASHVTMAREPPQPWRSFSSAVTRECMVNVHLGGKLRVLKGEYHGVGSQWSITSDG